MNIRRSLLVAIAAAALAAPALAAEAKILPKDTEVRLALETPVSTATAKPGDIFRLRTLAPIVVDGVERVPAGAPATGQVVHAQKSGAFGKAGELILAVRRIDVAPPIPLHKLEPLVGRDRTNGVAAASAAIGVFAAFIRGGQIVVPVGTEVVAYVAADTPLPAPESSTATAGENP